MADSNPTFRESFRHSGSVWCSQCHGEPVGCLACHAGQGTLQSARPSLLARVVHPIEPGSLDEQLCARCHQFALPAQGELERIGPDALPQRLSSTPAQDTVSEWSHSASASRGGDCTSCHEPHRAAGAHDRALVRETISVQADYREGQARFTLSARGSAHAVPTGDPFRRLRLTVCPPERCEEPLAVATLERRLSHESGEWKVADTRLLPPEGSDDARREIVLPVPELPVGARWRLFYHFADPRHEHALPHEEVRFLVAEGRLERS